MTLISDRFQLTDQVALVTGASRGIGAGIARLYAEAGAHVWLSSRNIADVEALAEELPNARAITLDVSDAASVKAAIMTIRKEAGRLDVLVNNAGVMRPAMLAMSSEADLDMMLDTNLKGAFLCAQLAGRLMVGKKHGVILNMASIMGRIGAPGHSAYCATKAGMIGLTHALAKELAPHNIRVNALAPGFIETDLTSDISGDAREHALAEIGLGRFGTIEDVANAALFLASPAAAYVTGQVLGIDGAMQI